MIADVILQKYSLIQSAFSYAVPAPLTSQIKEGQMVTVPFRNKKEKAIILSLRQEQPSPALKNIESILHLSPVLLPYQTTLAQWMAKYYVCPLFKTVNLFLPKFIWADKQEEWVERYLTIQKIQGSEGKGSKEKKVLSFLENQKEVSLETLQREIKNCPLPYLRSLEKKGFIHIKAGDIIPPYFKSYDLNSISVVQEKGLNSISVVQEKGLKKMTSDQQKACDTIRQNKKGVFLLHGITGSGKTEIYLHIAYENYKQQKQTLVLVPEIALTPQLIAYFFKVFGKNISVIHSKLSEGEKFTEWVRIKKKESYIIIGSRSALFSPFSDLGSIIIDEEHEWTYKNDQNPRYHARNVALHIAKMLSCNIILGSATPDIETYYKASSGEYVLLELPEKIIG